VAATIARTRGHGEPLDAGTRERVGGALGDPLGDVRVHRDETANELAGAVAARAFTTGSDVYFAAGAYAPGSADGDRLLTHELSHVVQQRGAPTTGPLTVSQPGDPLEVEADSASEALTAAPGKQLQRFVESEHKLIGDLGSSRGPALAPMVELAPGFSVTYGDIVAMAGDHFESTEQMKDLAKNPGPGKGTREEVEYVLAVEIHGEKNRKTEFSESAVLAADARYYGLAAKNSSHFLNPREGDTDRSLEETVTAQEGGKPMGGGATYHEAHRNALIEAARAGNAGEPINDALLQEAFSNHFLTDAFSSGHVRTPRQSLAEYWTAKVPMFFLNFKMYMAETIARHINDNNARGWVTSVDFLMTKSEGVFPEGSLPTIEATLKKKQFPEITFGDIVSGALHDYDNVHGVDVMIGGAQAKLLGDGQLVKNGQPTKEGEETLLHAVDAVRASLDEVEEAYQDGKSGMIGGPVVDKYLDRNAGLFAAEWLLPQVLPELEQDSQQVPWDFDNVQDLLANETFKEAVTITAHDKASDIESVGDDFKEGYKRDAFNYFLEKLKGGPDEIAKTLQEIIDYTPSTGGGILGHDEDAMAEDYFAKAKARGALGTLTLPAKQRLVHDVLTGATLGSEDAMIVELLDANHDDAVKIIEHFGWHWIWEDVDGDDLRDFIRKLGPSFWRAQDIGVKKQEIKWLADGVTTDAQEETMIIILRTCTPSEVREIDDDVGGLMGLGFDLTGEWDDEFDKLRSG
jgi:hypothetical protein